MKFVEKDKIEDFDFGNFLKDAARDQGISLKALCESIDVNYRRVTGLTTKTFDKRSINYKEFILLMKALDLSIDDFIDMVLGNPTNKNRKRKNLVNHLNSEELNVLNQLVELSDDKRQHLMKLLSFALEAIKVKS